MKEEKKYPTLVFTGRGIKKAWKKRIFRAIQDLNTIVIKHRQGRTRIYCRGGRWFWKNEGLADAMQIPQTDILTAVEIFDEDHEIEKILVIE